MIDLKPIKQKKAQSLRSVADELMKVHPIDQKTFTFNTREILLNKPPDELINNFSEWVGQGKLLYVYYFHLADDADFKSVYRKVLEAKEQKIGDRAYPRINTESKYLYVGSSKGIVRRFKEHLGFGHKGTYAMQLAYWCEGLNFDIKFFIMSFRSDTKKEVLQAFEDSLWETLKPMLGRRGAR